RDHPNDRIIIGRTSVLLNGESRHLTGGGNYRNGIPPTIIRLKEPLSIRVVDVRINGEPVENILVDGVTEHTFIVEVSFSGKPVPDGTPVFLTVGGKNPSKISLYSSVVYTSQLEDPYLQNGIKSYAQF